MMNMCALFEYDHAIHAAQKEQWQEAKEKIHPLVARQPDNASLLYDAGVIAAKNEDHAQAKAYFDAAVQKKDASRQLKEQAYFNKGNTHVALQELKEALLSYEQTLMLNPDNEAAQHNHEVVKQLLEKQEQQQNQQNQDQQKQQDNEQDNKDQKQDKQDKQQKKDKKNGDDEHDCQKEQSSDGDSADGDDKKEQSQEGDGQDDRFDKKGDKEDGKESRSDQKQQQADQDIERDRGGKSGQDPHKEKQKQEREKQSDHQSPHDELEGTQEQDMQAQEKEQEFDERGGAAAHLDPKLQEVLAQRSDRDAQLSKQLVKALVNKETQEMKGQRGQNNW